MGLFDFIRTVFTEKAVLLEPEDITLDETKTRLKAERAKREETFSEEAGSVIQSIRGLIDGCAQKLTLLEDARLKNSKISERELALMHGNKKSFLQMSRLFLGRSGPPDTRDFESLFAYSEQFAKNLVLFNKSTKRSFHILNEFFVHETRSVGLVIKDIENLIADLSKLLEASPKNIDDAIGEIEAIQSRIKDTKRLEEEASRFKELIIKKKEAIIGNEQRIKELSTTPDFVAFRQTEQEIDDENRSLKFLRSELINQFSSIEHALKKYEKISLDADIIKEYLKDSVTANRADGKHKILSVIKNLTQLLETEQLEMNSKKRARALDHLKRINRDFLVRVRTKEHALLDNIEKKKDILKRNATYKQIVALEEENQRIDDERSTTEKKVIYLTRSLEKDSEEIGTLILQLKGGVAKILGNQVKIKNPMLV